MTVSESHWSLGPALCAALLAIAWGHGVEGQDALELAPFIGCYELDQTAWDPPYDSGWENPVPKTFSLSAERGATFPERGLLVRPKLAGGGSSGATWRPLAPDSVEIHWVRDFVGFRLTLGFVGGEATGVAQTVTDEAPSVTRYAWVAIRAVACRPLSEVGRGSSWRPIPPEGTSSNKRASGSAPLTAALRPNRP